MTTPTDVPAVLPVSVVKVCAGFVFTEGPVADGEGNLYFTDSIDSKIYRSLAPRRENLYIFAQ
jgi:hypothetical protein